MLGRNTKKIITHHDVRTRVQAQLSNNLVHGHSDYFGVDYYAIQPSPTTYPYQYFWDTCLHNFILTQLGEFELAKKCFRSLYAMQDKDGYVGHMLYWSRLTPGVWTDTLQARFKELNHPHMSALIQPPLSAQALKHIWMHTHDRDYLAEMLPKLKKHFDWLAGHRDFDGDGLISIITMFESGIDWKPSMDVLFGISGPADERLYNCGIGTDYFNFVNDYNLETIRQNGKFLVKEVAFNTIYARNLEVLAELCRELNDVSADKYSVRAKNVVNAVQTKMYDEQAKAFWDLGPNDKPLKVLTPTIFFPIALRETSEERARAVLDAHFHNKKEFATKYPLPSVAINDPAFVAKPSKFLWRGPTWALNNWYVYKALSQRGFSVEADILRNSIKALVAKSGFREYYNPFTGQGGGAEHFTWSGLILDMVAPDSKASV